MSSELYRQLGSIEPGFPEKHTEKHLKRKGHPVDYFESLTDAHLLDQNMVDISVGPERKNGSYERKGPPGQTRQGRTFPL